jgi:hypothetical protein
VAELSPLNNPSDDLFALGKSTPPDQRLQVITMQELNARKLLLRETEVKWPTVGGGLTKGRMAIYISVDREGHVREAWPYGSDNADLEDYARNEVRKWQFKRVTTAGVPAQMETLTFDFETSIESAKSKPVLPENEARKLAIKVVEPHFGPSAPRGQDLAVRVSVSEDGHVAGVSNPNHLDGPGFMPLLMAVRQWTFHPYVLNGKPVAFDTDLTFHVK